MGYEKGRYLINGPTGEEEVNVVSTEGGFISFSDGTMVSEQEFESILVRELGMTNPGNNHYSQANLSGLTKRDPNIPIDDGGMPVLGTTEQPITPKSIQQPTKKSGIAATLLKSTKKIPVNLTIELKLDLPTPAGIGFLLDNFDIAPDDLLTHLMPHQDNYIKQIRQAIKNHLLPDDIED